MVRAAYRFCPSCGNSKQREMIFRCRKCMSVCCVGCKSSTLLGGDKCPACGYSAVLLPVFEEMGRIDCFAMPMQAGFMRNAPPLPTDFDDPPQPQRVRGPRQRPPEIDTEPEDIDFPESAPPNAPQIGHEKPISKYSRKNAITAIERSNVDQSRPQDRHQAEHLRRYLHIALKSHAAAFIEDAARDESLPKNVRAFYIHVSELKSRS